MNKWAILVSAGLLFFFSCTWVHDDKVVARIGKQALYLSQVQNHIPAGVSPEDSAAFARKFIDDWAAGILFRKAVTENLGGDDSEIQERLEEYRQSLYKYRYEQIYLASRIDTLVTDEQVQEYYEGHKEFFDLEAPILKVRFLNFMSDSPYRDEMIESLVSGDFAETVMADSVASKYVIRYVDYSEEWIDAVRLSREFNLDYGTMLSLLKGNFITLASEERADERVAYVCDIRRRGVAPLDFCYTQVRDIILNNREHQLLDGLERELLDRALSDNELEIY